MPQSGAGLKPMIPAGAQDTMFAVYRIPEDFAHGRLYYAASWNPWFSRLSLVALPIKDAPARDNGGIVKPGN